MPGETRWTLKDWVLVTGTPVEKKLTALFDGSSFYGKPNDDNPSLEDIKAIARGLCHEFAASPSLQVHSEPAMDAYILSQWKVIVDRQRLYERKLAT